MYRVSPFTYLVSAMLSTGVANTAVVCAANEFMKFAPPNGTTCGEYMKTYISTVGGYLQDASNTKECSYCTISDTNTFLASVQSNYDDRWRNFGYVSRPPAAPRSVYLTSANTPGQHSLGLHHLQRLRGPGPVLACQGTQEEAGQEEGGVTGRQPCWGKTMMTRRAICYRPACASGTTGANNWAVVDA